ncbi:odr-4-like protein [Labeo rohita]|uniref:Protein odr-4 homolog n=1 Tax=Labeo rohita TaxID=84645 RepID=A0A498N5I5_LABRO|nr:odr-4-like protein [Labeo rohita]
MGRSYFVDEAVEEYLGGLQAAPGSCVTGLLAGQSSPQRDFVVLAVQTPHRENEGQPKSSKGVSPLDDIDVEWVTEHAKQSSAKPADWKYQTGVSSSWPMLTCSVKVDLQIPVTGSSSDNTDKSMKVTSLCSGQQALPRRVFAPMPIAGLSVCDYMFPDESTADVAERLKEMLDCETPEEDIDTSLESNQWITDSHSDDSSKHVTSVQAENPKIQKAPQYYAGVAIAAAIALLATATSLLYLSE